MDETAGDVRELQRLIDESASRMGPHMRSIFTPERRLSAAQLAAHLDGIFHVAFATVNAKGQPRVAPLDAIFHRARFHVSTGGDAARLRHIRRSPSVSLTYFHGDEIGVIVHGTAVVLEQGTPDADALEPVYVRLYGSSPFSWGEEVVLIRVDPEAVFTYSSEPAQFATR
jgi:uncharacterized pyridoxamine 5'-phosphate oxidase family protein